MRKLIIYPNCSKGGVTSVIRGRARAEQHVQFDVVFFNDRGGRNAFDDLPNVSVRIIRQDRSGNYFNYLLKHFRYDAISVLSHPKSANLLSENPELAVTYEFHSSDTKVMEREIGELNLDQLARIIAPTPQMTKIVSKFLPARIRPRVYVETNLVDTKLFSEDGSTDFFANSRFKQDDKGIPLLWVGRFDLGKGYQYMIRTLAQLPDEYFAIFVVSLESDPERANRFYRECAEMGVTHRVRLLLNLPQSVMGNLYRSVREAGGLAVSTSLMESFGYTVAEALACGTPVAAFDLPVWDNFSKQELMRRVTSGDVQALARAIEK